MRKLFYKRLSIFLLSLTLAAGLAACGKGKDKDKSGASDTAPAVTTEAAGKTAAATETQAPTAAPSETAGETTAAEPAGEGLLSPLSGRPSTAEKNKRRVVAVMIDNHPNARNQAGWTQADMVIEMKVEGTYTRYMALFQSEDAPLVGPIRSARGYFIPRMYEFNAIYTHFGGSNEADHILSDPRYAEIDGMVVPSSVIWRYNDTGKWAPHNAYSSLEALRKYAADRGYAAEYEIKGYKFNAEPKAPADGQTANNLLVAFAGNNTSQFLFDASKGLYTFTKDGTQQFDENNKEPVLVQNIIVQTTEYGSSTWGPSLKSCRVTGKGEGLYVSQGKAIPITWEKASDDAQTMYYTKDGQELVLNPGLTWIEVTDTSTDVTIK